jgi:polyhydroxyalkanoate synthesis regulator phasin
LAQDDDNVVLRLLREIRGDTSDLRLRMAKVERRLDELGDGMTTALGMSAHSNIVVEQTASRIDELQDQIEGLRRRVSDLEARQ